MASIESRTVARSDGLHPFDPLRDLAAVADLIEEGFGEELDPVAYRMLAQMRRLSRPRLALFAAPPPSMHGYIWVEDGIIVGNLSLRRAAPAYSRGYLIGNVVVHPDYRRRGIARALMEAAIAEVERKGGWWIGLEVRADNRAATHLYEALGFTYVGTTTHYLRDGGLPWPSLRPPRRTFYRKARPADRPHWLALAHRLYGKEQAAVLEIDGRAYSYGQPWRWLDLWLIGLREWAWLEAADEPRWALHLRRDRPGGYTLWRLYPSPQLDAAALETVLALAVGPSQRRPWPVVTIVPSHPALEAALRDLGFHRHRTLRQMRLSLRHPRRIIPSTRS